MPIAWRAGLGSWGLAGKRPALQTSIGESEFCKKNFVFHFFNSFFIDANNTVLYSKFKQTSRIKLNENLNDICQTFHKLNYQHGRMLLI